MARDDTSDRDRFARGLPDHHDPTARMGGAPPALSALTLRMVLAGLGVVVFGGGALVLLATGRAPAAAAVAGAVAVAALVNLVVVARRKRRGEPG